MLSARDFPLPPSPGLTLMSRYPPVAIGELLDDGAGVVAGAVVDHQNLVAIRGVVEREHRFQRVADHQALVVGRDQHGDLGPVEAHGIHFAALPLGPESVEEARDGEDELVGDHEPDQDHRQHEGDGEDELKSGFAHAARRERRGRTRTIR